MLTYNHAPFVREAIESVLMQKTDFPFEVVVGEDCSTDQTRDVLREYTDHRVRLLPADSNLGMVKNLARTLDECRGEFVAIIEGDDFWTDDCKLQKQVTYLQENDDVAICHHSVSLKYEVSGFSQDEIFSDPIIEHLDFDKLLEQNRIASCSVVFRRKHFQKLPHWFAGLNLCDWPMFVVLSLAGRVGFLPGKMATYRVHSGGVWSTSTYLKKARSAVDMYCRFKKHLPKSHLSKTKRHLSRVYFEIAREYRLQHNVHLCLLYMCLSAKEDWRRSAELMKGVMDRRLAMSSTKSTS
jgi:glycosyltransferase involved in cell wall biosynthesis